MSNFGFIHESFNDCVACLVELVAFWESHHGNSVNQYRLNWLLIVNCKRRSKHLEHELLLRVLAENGIVVAQVKFEVILYSKGLRADA